MVAPERWRTTVMANTQWNFARISQSRLSLVPRRVLRRSAVASPIALILNGYLAQRGWYRSYSAERPVDRHGGPLPWYTYSCTSFLESRLSSSMRVFEFGSGMSSLWYAQRVDEVVSI